MAVGDDIIVSCIQGRFEFGEGATFEPSYLSMIVSHEDHQVSIFHTSSTLIKFPVSILIFATTLNFNFNIEVVDISNVEVEVEVED